jgi:hypothetical protein
MFAQRGSWRTANARSGLTFGSVGSHRIISGRKHMKTGLIVTGLLAVLAMPVVAHAQGVVRGAQEGSAQGAKEGNKALGPVGGAVGGVVGGATGAAVGGVKGALGVPSSKPKKKKAAQ